MRRPKQLEINLCLGRRGGWRPRSGRKRGTLVQHLSREEFRAPRPCHVTVKVQRDIGSLRRVDIVRSVEEAFRRSPERIGFRLVHYSFQGDHAHLIVEADSPEALGRGMKSLAARFARAVNRALGRAGRVLADRYHLHVLATPREVRNALAYVLLNARKHVGQRLAKLGKAVRVSRGLDPASSARWFEGWRSDAEVDRSTPRALRAASAVAQARTWLLKDAWRRHGLIDPEEIPGRLDLRARVSKA